MYEKDSDTHWIGHCLFQDGPETVETYFGRKYEHRDGLLDITNGEYAYAYSLGVGKNSQIYAESNVADIAGKDYTSFVKVFGGKQLTTVNNMFNGKFVDTFNDTLTPVDWKSELFTTIDPVNEVKEKVLHNAGTIKISQ